MNILFQWLVFLIILLRFDCLENNSILLYIKPKEGNDKELYWIKQNNKEIKAELLWLWHDYRTEMYDLGLSGSNPIWREDGSVRLTGETSILSIRYAGQMKRYMDDMARFYQIPKEVMKREKELRLRETTQRRMERYESLKDDEPQNFDFIHEYFEMLRRMEDEKIKVENHKYEKAFGTIVKINQTDAERENVE